MGGEAGLTRMEPIQPMGAAHDEVRECIRRLVAVIRRSSTGGSPVDGDQVEHIQKVIRVLSLSEEQVSSMRFEDRAQVLKIRKKQRPVEDRLISASHKHEPQATSHKPRATKRLASVPSPNPDSYPYPKLSPQPEPGAQDTEQRAAENEVSQQCALICQQQ